MKLYVGPLSLFSAKARIALAEKGLEPQIVPVGWSRADRYEPHHPDVVALNPKRQVPVLVDGDLVVYDSTQIFEYLEERVPEPALYPRDLAGRVQCRRLEAAGDEIWFPRVWDLIEERFYPTDSPRSERAEAAVRGLGDLARELEKELVGREYLVGAYSVADISTFIQVNAAAALGAPIPDDCPAVARWFERVAARAAVAPVLSDLRQAAARAMSS